MLLWSLFLLFVLGFGAPAMDRRDWLPLQAPYRQALALRRAGAAIACAGLSETQAGFASLTFQQRLPTLADPARLQAALDQPGPVAVLVERAFWARAQAQGVRGQVVPTEADSMPVRRQNKAPVLVLNRPWIRTRLPDY